MGESIKALGQMPGFVGVLSCNLHRCVDLLFTPALLALVGCQFRSIITGDQASPGSRFTHWPIKCSQEATHAGRKAVALPTVASQQLAFGNFWWS